MKSISKFCISFLQTAIGCLREKFTDEVNQCLKTDRKEYAALSNIISNFQFFIAKNQGYMGILSDTYRSTDFGFI